MIANARRRTAEKTLTRTAKKKKDKKKKTAWDLIQEHQKKPFLRVPEKYKEEVFG